MKIRSILLIVSFLAISFQANAKTIKKAIPQTDKVRCLSKLDSIDQQINSGYYKDAERKILSELSIAQNNNQAFYYTDLFRRYNQIEHLLNDFETADTLVWQFLYSSSNRLNANFKTVHDFLILGKMMDERREWLWRSEQIPDDHSFLPKYWSRKKYINEMVKLVDQLIEWKGEGFADDSNLIVNGYDLKIRSVKDKFLFFLLENGISYEVKYKFPENINWYMPTDSFLSFDLKPFEQEAIEFSILRIYQYLIKKNELTFDLMRLKYVSSVHNTESYWSVLNKKLAAYSGNPEQAQILAEMAVAANNDQKKFTADKISDYIRQFPQGVYKRYMESAMEQLRDVEIAVTGEKIIQPEMGFPVRITYKNFHKVCLEVYKTNPLKSYEHSVYGKADYQSLLKKLGKLTQKMSFDLQAYDDYQEHTAEVALNGLKNGTYLLVLRNLEPDQYQKEEYSVVEFQVSNHVVIRKGKQYQVVNANNGKPLKTVLDLYVYSGKKYKLLKKVYTDALGWINLNLTTTDYNNYRLVAVNGEFFFDFSRYAYYEKPQEVNGKRSIAIFTDRRIYRPGQKIYFKALVFDEQKKVLSGEKVKIVLANYSGNQLYSKELNTNAFGSFSDSMDVPVNGINLGGFEFSTETPGIEFANDASVSIEEYKRPKFEVKWTQPDKTIHPGDDIELEVLASAYAGYPVSDANVRFNVRQITEARVPFWCKIYPPYEGSKQLLDTNAKTNESGAAKLKFKIPNWSAQDKQFKRIRTFTVEATVTDINGESHTESLSFMVSNVSRTLSVQSAGGWLLGDSVYLNISHVSLQGTHLPINGYISLKKCVNLNTDKRRGKSWSTTENSYLPESVAMRYNPQGRDAERYELIRSIDIRNFKGDVYAIDPSMFDSSAKYKLEVFAIEGSDTISDYSVIKFNAVKGQYKMDEYLSIYPGRAQGQLPGEELEVVVAGKLTGNTVFLELLNKNGSILKEHFVMNGEVINFKYKLTEGDQGGVTCKVYTVSDYLLYQSQYNHLVPYVNKELKLTLGAFRSDLEPGSKEKWILKIQSPDAKSSNIETLAGMYDASLDALAEENDWSFFPYHQGEYGYHLNSEFDLMRGRSYVSNYFYSRIDDLSMGRSFDLLTAGDLRIGVGPGKGKLNYRFKADSKGYLSNVAYEDNPVLEKSWGFSGADVTRGQSDFEYNDRDASGDGVIDDLKRKNDLASEPLKVRTNLKETAFFFPHLYSNPNDGSVSMEFTMPEALTKWKFQSLSHSQSMQLGHLTQYVTTSKKLMVEPNLPRFVRTGDKIEIVCKVVNKVDQMVSVNIKMRITDPVTGKELLWLREANSKTVSIPASASSSVSFGLSVPEFKGAVAIAFIAESGGYNDGEEKTVMVLPAQSLVTVSMPITIRQPGVRDIRFEQLLKAQSNTLVHQSLQLEMSSNPAWYAVRSLPYLMEFGFDCSEQLFSKIFANSVSLHILKSNPAISDWLAGYRKTGNWKGPLDKNQELKSVLLDETPWLNEAKSESERMQQLAVLMDSDQLNEKLVSQYNELLERQNSDGSFSWYKGMNGSEYITQIIVTGFIRLKMMGTDISRYESLLAKAMSYLDDQARSRYQSMKKNNKRYYPNSIDVQYLYCNVHYSKFYSFRKDKVMDVLFDSLSRKRGSLSLLSQAQLAVAMHLSGRSQEASDILNAFDQQAKTSDEMGMYWLQNQGGWYWYESKIETHAAIMEAYRLITGDKTKMREQQIWLIRQKQTSSWSNTRSTADACYELLMQGQLLNHQQKIVFTVNNNKVDVDKSEAGTGYFRYSVPVQQITPESGKIKIEASGSDFAYGAVYWQYTEDLSKIPASQSGMSITKKLYRVQGQTLTELISASELKVGDKVKVVLTLSSTRDMEFVHIKDMRASCMEPLDVLSTYKYTNGLSYYQVIKDVSANFFVDFMARGTYKIEYEVSIQQSGQFETGVSSIQCMYAPEYNANSASLKVIVKPQ